jgi:hypothetical protein
MRALSGSSPPLKSFQDKVRVSLQSSWPDLSGLEAHALKVKLKNNEDNIAAIFLFIDCVFISLLFFD